jgi:predicted DNA-binding transcriptional regulator AlpA
MPEFLTVKEVTKIFRLKKEETVREWIKKGVFPNAIKTDGYLIPKGDVDSLIEQAKCSTECPPPAVVKTPSVAVKVVRGGFVNGWK